MTEPRLEPQTIEPPHLGFAHLPFSGPTGSCGSLFRERRLQAHVPDGSLLPTAWGAVSLEPGDQEHAQVSAERRQRPGPRQPWGEGGTGEGGAKRDLGSGADRSGGVTFLF